MYLTNAFSLNMLASLNANIAVRTIEAQDVRDFNDHDSLESAVGHADTAAVFSTILHFPVPANRITIQAKPGDRLIVGQYCGPRLPEGATTLPQGATITWTLVVIRSGR